MIALRPRVQNTPEYRRVSDLPRRKLTPELMQAAARRMTRRLRLPGVTEISLHPEQGICLEEAEAARGGLFVLPPGRGKTLLGYLLCVLFGSERSVVIGPKSLLPQTLDAYKGFYRQWKRPAGPIRYIAREHIASSKGVSLLEDYRPGVVVFDESDDGANFERSLATRIDRYKRKHPGVVVVSLTATPTRFSVLAIWHHLVWGLGDGAPVPRTLSEAKQWAAVLDDLTRSPLNRPHPGALGATRDLAIRWFSRRLRETPGVVVTKDDGVQAPLVVRTLYADPCPKIDDAFERLLYRGKNPAGISVDDAMSFYRLETQLGCGFCTEYADPKPSEEWLRGRREVGRFIRRQIAISRESDAPLDTAKAVLDHFREAPVVRTWLRLRAEFKPKMRTVWFSDTTIQCVKRWLERQTVPSIVWCGSVDFGQCLSEATGVPYYGAGALASGGRMLHRAHETEKHILCSWNVAKKGFDNLWRWHNQLVVFPPSSGKWTEQLIARTHRHRQPKEVIFTVLITSGVVEDMLASVFREAAFNRELLHVSQKVLRAKLEITHRERKGYRWATGETKSKKEAEAWVAKT